jgi:hypothetical protein
MDKDLGSDDTILEPDSDIAALTTAESRSSMSKASEEIGSMLAPSGCRGEVKAGGVLDRTVCSRGPS